MAFRRSGFYLENAASPGELLDNAAALRHSLYTYFVDFDRELDYDSAENDQRVWQESDIGVPVGDTFQLVKPGGSGRLQLNPGFTQNTGKQTIMNGDLAFAKIALDTPDLQNDRIWVYSTRLMLGSNHDQSRIFFGLVNEDAADGDLMDTNGDIPETSVGVGMDDYIGFHTGTEGRLDAVALRQGGDKFQRQVIHNFAAALVQGPWVDLAFRVDSGPDLQNNARNGRIRFFSRQDPKRPWALVAQFDDNIPDNHNLVPGYAAVLTGVTAPSLWNIDYLMFGADRRYIDAIAG